MQPVLLGEYRNQNSRRNYPFVDNSILADTDGNPIPTDMIIDVYLYPFDLVGSVYMSEIDITEQVIYFSDSGTNERIGDVSIPTVGDTVYVYEYGKYGRQIGVVVFGDGVGLVSRGAVTRLFDSAVTELVPTAYIPLNQVGVRGFELPDGTLVTGAVQFLGVDGMAVSSETGALVFSAVGTPILPDDCEDDCPRIEEICIERTPGSLFSVAQVDTCTFSIAAYDVTLDDICAANKARSLPDAVGNLPLKSKPGEGICDPPVPPPDPPEPGPNQAFCIAVSPCNGNINIVTPSAMGARNPIAVIADDQAGAGGANRLVMPVVDSAAEAQPYLDSFKEPTRLPGKLTIAVKGLSVGRGK